EVDAKIEGLAHQCDGLRLGEAGAEPNAAVAATAEPGHADLEARPAEGGILHVALSAMPPRVARHVAPPVTWVTANGLECGRARAEGRRGTPRRGLQRRRTAMLGKPPAGRGPAISVVECCRRMSLW